MEKDTDEELKQTMNQLGMTYKRTESHHLYIDGVACVGKTELIRRLEESQQIPSSYNDLSERSRYIYKGFLDKNNCTVSQSVFNLLNIYWEPKHECSIVDRSPLTDLWYSIILKVLHAMEEEESKHLVLCSTFKDYMDFVENVLLWEGKKQLKSIWNNIFHNSSEMDIFS